MSDAGNCAQASVADQGVHASPLLKWMDEVSAFGATPAGGLDRQALTPAECEARAWVVARAHALGLDVATDAIGNLFMRWEGRDPRLPPVLTGSHLDSQPKAGRFDGTYGVLAGLAAVAALQGQGIRPRRAIAVVAWTNEEGTRFQPGLMGARAHADPGRLETMLDARDRNGTTVRAALAAWRATLDKRVGTVPLGGPAAAYVEAHIEQGPVLERHGCTIGAVTGIQGIRRYAVDIRGHADHAGTTPRSARRDALATAARLLVALEEATADATDVLRFTVGQLMVEPGGISVVPDRVRFTIDLRHPDGHCLEAAASRVVATCRNFATQCALEVDELSRSAPQNFDERLVTSVEAAARRLGHAVLRLPSGAGHDAQAINALCPTAMIFIPCRGGISHNEAEYAAPDHMQAGTDVLARVLHELADTP